MHTVSNYLAASLELQLFGAVFKRSIILTVYAPAAERWKGARSYGITDQSETRCYLLISDTFLQLEGQNVGHFIQQGNDFKTQNRCSEGQVQSISVIISTVI